MVDFFAPQQQTPKREAERLKTLAESLQQSGQYRGNEMVSGQVVKQSPLEHLARGLSTAAGGYFEGQSQAKSDEDEAMMSKRLSEALNQWGSDPQAAAQMLAQDPRTADMAMKLMGSEVDYGRQKERWSQEDALRREQMQMMGQRSSGNVPAPMQIANQMFELEQAMHNPEMPEDQRFLAQRQYNLLGQAAKTYGFDRGLQAGGMDGYNSVYGQQQDPMQANAQAVQQQQGQIGANPNQRPDMAPAMGEIPGYGQAAAGIAAQKKMAEGRSSEIGKRQGENENMYRSMVSRMPQLEDTAERLSRLGQAATYTMGGQAFNLAARELGLDVPDAATARAEYISMVDNEILPLLRDTFGAQFTQREGESLKATLGNPNASPKEKDAVLRSFIRTKAESLDSLRRELDAGETLPSYTPRDVTIGGQTYNPSRQNPERESIKQRLLQSGASEEEVNAYIRERGL